MTTSTLRIVDLFAGIGGLRKGALNAVAQAGFTPEVVFTSEIKKEAIATLELNYPGEEIHGDITKIDEKDIPAHSLLLAGFPCQAFSYAGKREGFEDQTKGTLFFDVLRILRHHKPQFFVLENVEGLVTHDPDLITKKGRTLTTILTSLQDAGYDVSYGVIQATDHGVPQARRRLFITGSLSAAPGEPDETLARKVTQILSEPLSSVLETGITDQPAELTRFQDLLTPIYPDLSVLNGRIFRDWRGGARNIHSWNINYKGTTTAAEKAFLEALMPASKKSHWVTQGLIRKGEGFALTPQEMSDVLDTPVDNIQTMLTNLENMGYVGQDDPGRYRITSGKLTMPISHILRTDDYVGTLTATDADRFAVLDNGLLRRFTGVELRRLFGFPDDYLIPDIRKSRVFDLFGNSVVVPVATNVTAWLLAESQLDKS